MAETESAIEGADGEQQTENEPKDKDKDADGKTGDVEKSENLERDDFAKVHKRHHRDPNRKKKKKEDNIEAMYSQGDTIPGDAAAGESEERVKQEMVELLKELDEDTTPKNVDDDDEKTATQAELIETTTRIIRILQEAIEAGVMILGNLDIQLEQLDLIDFRVRRLTLGLADTEQNLANLEQCCGLCVLPWNSRVDYESTGDYQRTWSKSGLAAELDLLKSGAIVNSPIWNFLDSTPADQPLTKLDENLLQITEMMQVIRDMSLDIHQETSLQCLEIPEMLSTAISLADRLSSATQRSIILLGESIPEVSHYMNSTLAKIAL